MKKLLKKFLSAFFRKTNIVHLDVTYSLPGERFKGKRVLVTGGSSGIGLAIAKAFLAEGAKVMACARNSEKLSAIEKEQNNTRFRTMALDIADVTAIPNLLNQAVETMGQIDIFINAAGVSAYDGNIMKEEMYDYICDINQKGLFYMNHYEGEYMVSQNIRGKIINITSKAGEKIGFDPYTLSKWGANAITRGIARKLACHHINVNGIAPGCVPTNITADLQKHINQDNVFTTAHETKRFTMPEEVAEVALFLASGAANNIVGQIIAIDGGSYR